ncbi:hypothetical protein [Paraburkholderia sp. MM5477-R1]|uniref:hypothetical protein n=1 Tax=Paraburkholderia sp. MM5477-R1 TaxID=2991062 RepID=UPI003D21A758
MRKIYGLTGLRAFAALLAVVHHFADNEGGCHRALCNSCVYCFLYNDGDVGLTTFGMLRIVLQAWRGTSGMTLPDEMALPECDAKLPTEAGEPANRDNRQTAAQRIADELFERDTANGCRDSLAGYSQRVVEEMNERWRCFNAYLRTNWPLRSAMPMRRFRQISYVGRICVH